jgi:hypothetical protein
VRRWHPASDGHARILAASLGLLLLLLEILVVSHLLLLVMCHIARLQAAGARDIRLRSIHAAVRDVFGRLGGKISSVDAILRRRFGCVEARLRDVSETEARRRFKFQEGGTWIRFLPSGLVTKGCNFGVVKV